MEGLVHSILVILDGNDGSSLPGFVVSPYPHPDDQAFHLEEGENWYPPFVDCGTLHLGIAGMLHERWAKTYQDR